MLILKNIIKDYVAGDTSVRAMKDVSINFRENEFVAILGPSGSGKTTMLNIIGGLDRYNGGDLIINGKSTKTFTDDDWDTYRNHSIGFVFQTYNLIPHQTIVENVELALTLSGVTKKGRRQKAIEALEKVGLKNQIYKKPNQLSGGQMQRVSIARALINNPDIILADEPTGALDSETSVQIMELLKEIARDKLIIMVTHNPELANQYANRIINYLDGQLVGDSNPFVPTQEDFEFEKKKQEEEKAKGKKPSMSLITAFSLSLRNLFTKRGRTIMTAFAGSIGIIGIALVIALQNGINGYIDKVESDALLMFPMSVEQETVKMDDMMTTLMGMSPLKEANHEKDAVYVNNSFSAMVNTFISQATANNLKSFKKYLDDNKETIDTLCNDVQYNYSAPLNIYRTDGEKGIVQVNPMTMMDNMSMGGMEKMAAGIDMSSYTNLWKQLIGDNETIEKHYDVIYGRLPEKFNEVVVIVDGNNEINEMMSYALGLMDQSEFSSDLMGVMTGEKVEDNSGKKYSYQDILDMKYKLVLSCDYMVKNEKTGLWDDARANKLYVKGLVEKGLDIKIVGIIRPDENNVLSIGTGNIGYTKELVDYVLENTAKSEVVKQQLKNQKKDVITGLDFVDMTVNDFDLADIDLKEIDYNYLDITPFLSMAENVDLTQIDITDMSSIFNFGDLSDLQKKLMEGFLNDEQVLALKQAYLDTVHSKCSLEKTFTALGYTTSDSPSSIYLYPKDFDSKKQLNDMVDFYNERVTNDGRPELTITCTDLIGVMMTLVTQVVNIVSYTLIIFVAISLVVSSIMIGIITYVSVIERTKEIGILRSIGASKRDISNVFNAETTIIGFSAGLVGVLITTLIEIPLNLILRHLTGTDITAVLPFVSAIILIAISIFLTFIAGLVPSSMAAKKDPVEALRTE